MSRLLLSLAFFIAAGPVWAQAPLVVSVSPAAETVVAPPSGALTVSFDVPLDPASVTASSFRVSGRWTGPVEGTVALEDGDQTVRFTPSAPLQAGDLVLVQLSRAVTSASGTPMASGYAWLFWTAASSSTMDFSEDYRIGLRQPGEGLIIVYGAHGGDLDGDGDSDLITSQEAATDARVLLNDGLGGYEDFTVFPLAGGSVPSPLEAADFNHDGHLDVAIGNTTNDKVHVLLGDGAGGFLSITPYATAGTSTRSVAVGDFDGDGHDDLVTASRTGGVLSLLRGGGDGTFGPAEAFDAGGANETALATTDADGDGRLDLFVGDNAGGVSVCLGDGAGGFACGPKSGGGQPWMIAAGDLDGDAIPDVAVASSGANGVEVLYGDGAGGFKATDFYPRGSFAIAIDLGDLDGDGDLDVVSSNYGSADFSVFENTAGVLVFAQRLQAAIAGSCMTLHDRDGDGRLDLTGVDERADLALFFSPPPVLAGEPGAPDAKLTLVPTANPFREQTALRLVLPAPGVVRLRVFDALGREVAVLMDGPVEAGTHVVAWDAAELPAGRYLARLEAAGETVAVPLSLVR